MALDRHRSLSFTTIVRDSMGQLGESGAAELAPWRCHTDVNPMDRPLTHFYPQFPTGIQSMSVHPD